MGEYYNVDKWNDLTADLKTITKNPRVTIPLLGAIFLGACGPSTGGCDPAYIDLGECRPMYSDNQSESDLSTTNQDSSINSYTTTENQVETINNPKKGEIDVIATTLWILGSIFLQRLLKKLRQITK